MNRVGRQKSKVTIEKEASHPTGHNCPDDMKYNDKAGKCEIENKEYLENPNS